MAIQNLFDHATVVPANFAVDAGSTLTLGVRFYVVVPGTISAIAFYKSAAHNSTTLVVQLYLQEGEVLLSEGTLTDVPLGAGWVTVPLSTPVPIDAMTAYLAAAWYPNAAYPYQSNAFAATEIVRGDIHGIDHEDISMGISGNGRFYYDQPSIRFPPAGNRANFFIDVDFTAAGSNNYTLTADTRSHAITGTAATLRLTRRLRASPRAVEFLHSPTALNRGRRLAAATGSYTITAAAATLRAARTLRTNLSWFALTGTQALLTLSGSPARVLLALPSAMAISATAAALRHGRRLVAAAAADSTLTGTAATLLHGRRVDATPGDIAIDGTDATLRLTRLLNADPDSMVIEPGDAQLGYQRAILAEAGSIAVATADATLSVEVIPVAATVTLDGAALVSMLSDLQTWGWVADLDTTGAWTAADEDGPGGWAEVTKPAVTTWG